MSAEVAYGRYDEAYRAIHSALMSLTAPPPGRKVTKLAFTWNADATAATVKAYDGADLLFTLTFTYSAGNLQDVTRS